MSRPLIALVVHALSQAAEVSSGITAGISACQLDAVRGFLIDATSRRTPFLNSRSVQIFPPSRSTHAGVSGALTVLFATFPYEHLALRLATVPEAYTGAVVHDTLGHRVSPSLLRAR